MAERSHEHRMQLAIEELDTQLVKNYLKTAKKYQLVRSTLTRRYQGQTLSKAEFISDRKQRLTKAQEEALIELINKLTDRALPPTSQIVKNLAEEITGTKVGKNWTSDFVKRHKNNLKSAYLRNIDNLRAKADNAPMFELFYDLSLQKIEKYNITFENIYNWDEKGFIIGLASAVKRIMTREALDSGRIIGARQDGNREFISLLACVCADGTSLPPALIYKGESSDIRDSWVEDLKEDDQVYFAASANGWSSDSLGLNWLQNIFERHTAAKAGRGRRLLLVDGHSSHVNMSFLDWADSKRIVIGILPPHSTHRLQPLDVGLFSPLAVAYSKGLNTLM